MSEQLAGLGISVDDHRRSNQVAYTSKLEPGTCHRRAGNSNIKMNSQLETRCKPPRIPSSPSLPTMRSMTAMRGLLLAEVGDGTVELDVAGNGSGFREGRRIVLEHVTPGGGSKDDLTADLISHGEVEQTLTRHGTLLSVGADPGRNAAELKSLLGNSRARLRPGATVLPPACEMSGTKTGKDLLTFEQAKVHARVEVDIILDSNICVQGSYLKGLFEIRIRKRLKNESIILLGGAKVRVVGFECIPNTDIRHTFYHHAAPLSSIAKSPLLACHPGKDVQSFTEATEGRQVIPFTMFLPIEGESAAKGVLHDHSGARVQYIAMASIKVKDQDTNKQSVAHFYRHCEIWPRLNPSVLLAPAPKPLQASTSKRLFMGGRGKLGLTATLHRLHWIAGQQCCIQVAVKNDTKKAVKSLTLALIRTTVIFRPRPYLDALPHTREQIGDPDACQTWTTQKQVAECTLQMGHHATRRHVTARGWWTGVSPGENSHFSHFLLLPADALSISRGRLLEVEYSIRVSLGTGSLASDVHVILPVRIINFLSVDPPPSFSAVWHEGVQSCKSVHGSRYIPAPGHHSRPVIEGIFPCEDDRSSLGDLLLRFNGQSPLSDNIIDVSPTSPSEPTLHSLENSNPDEIDADSDTSPCSYMVSDLMNDGLDRHALEHDVEEADDNKIWSTDDYDQERQVASFADLYYASVEQDETDTNTKTNSWDKSAPGVQGTFRADQMGTAASSSSGQPTSVFSGIQSGGAKWGPSPFHLRVQEKLHAGHQLGLSSTAISQALHEATYELSSDLNCANESMTVSDGGIKVGATVRRTRSASGGIPNCLEPAVDRRGYATVSKARPLPDAPWVATCQVEQRNECMNRTVQVDHPIAKLASGTPISADAEPRTLGTICHPTERTVCPRNVNDVEKSDNKPNQSTLFAGGPSAKGNGINSVKARIKELEDRAKAAGTPGRVTSQ